MQLKSWVDELQSNLLLDQSTGFITSLHLFVKAPSTSLSDENEVEYFRELGISIKEKIQGQYLAGRILRKLHQKRSVLSTSVENQPPNIEQQSQTVQDKRYAEPIYKIYCSLIEKTLQREHKRFVMMKREMPEIIKNDTF